MVFDGQAAKQKDMSIVEVVKIMFLDDNSTALQSPKLLRVISLSVRLKLYLLN